MEGILEAPRGQREVCPDGRYKAAYKNGPSASLFPCGGNGNGSCGGNGCANGGNGCVNSSNGSANGGHGVVSLGSQTTPSSPSQLAIPLPKAPIDAPLPAESSAPASLPPGVGGQSGDEK